ncbi:MAG: hypothetical protein SGPRY_006810, partial [Prymnesium sp.]
ITSQREQFENWLDTMVGERKGEERSQFLTKAKYDEILRCLESWSEFGSKHSRRGMLGYASAQEGTFKKKASLEEVMVVSHRDRMFDDICKIHVNGGHCKGRALHDAVHKAHGASISHKIQDLFVSYCPTCIEARPRKAMLAGHTPILTKGFGTRGQVDLGDLQSTPDGEFKYLMNYQVC